MIIIFMLLFWRGRGRGRGGIESIHCYLKDLFDKINYENVRDLYLGNLPICRELDNFEDAVNEKLDISQPFLNEKVEVAAFIVRTEPVSSVKPVIIR